MIFQKNFKMSNLPHGWSYLTLGDICIKPQYGWTSSASQNGDLKYIRTTDISSGNIDWDTVPYCRLKPDDVDKYKIRKNDIVVSRAGSIGVSYFFNEVPFNAVFASYLIRLQPLDNVNPKYVYYFLKSSDYWNSIKESSAGIAIPNVNGTKLAKIRIPVAPKKIQDEIVLKIEKILSLLELNQNKFNNLRSIEEKLLISFLRNEDSFYEEVKLGDYLEECNERIGENWRSCRKVGVSSEEGITDLRFGVKSEFSNYKIVADNSFVYNPMRINIGSIALYQNKAMAITSPDYVVFKIKKSISPRLLLKFLKSKYGLNEIANNTHGAVRERLYYEYLTNINFPLAPQEKQDEAEEIFKGLEVLQLKSDSLNKIFQKLIKSLLTSAYQGEIL